MKFQNNSMGNRGVNPDDKMSNLEHLNFQWKVDLTYIIGNSELALKSMEQLNNG